MMESTILTDWFDSDSKPARTGVYEIDWPDALNRKVFSYWDGKDWGWPVVDICGRMGDTINACFEAGASSRGVSHRWRGLSSPPLTEWFGPFQSPVNSGVYEIEGVPESLVRHFAYWDAEKRWGSTFCMGPGNFDDAIYAAGQYGKPKKTGSSTLGKWRGLAVQP